MIQINPITKLDLQQIKTAIEKIAREAQGMKAVDGQEDAVYVNTVPDVANTKEGQVVWYFDGVNYRGYVKLNNTIRTWTVT